MSTFVLVSGGGLGGWSFQRVARLLEAQGHTVYFPTLTGVGDRAHLVSADVDLDTHITDVSNLLFYEDLRDVVLVGHSYGGMVIRGTADRVGDRVAKLVFLDAPFGRSNAEAFPPIVEMRKQGQVVNGIELVVFPDENLVGFYGVTDPEDVAWMLQRLTPHPWRSLEQHLILENESALEAIPHYLIVSSSSLEMGAHNEDRVATARAQDRFWAIDSGHCLQFTAPEAVANALLEVASEPTLIVDRVAVEK